MAKLMVLYKTPKDPAAFDAYYFGTHVPLAKTLPGLRSYEVNVGPIATPAGASDTHLVATLTFDDMAAVGAAFASPEGLAAAADVANFAPDPTSVSMMMFDDKRVEAGGAPTSAIDPKQTIANGQMAITCADSRRCNLRPMNRKSVQLAPR